MLGKLSRVPDLPDLPRRSFARKGANRLGFSLLLNYSWDYI